MKNNYRGSEAIRPDNSSAATRLVWLGTLGVLVCASTASAVGFRLPNQDPEGIARGNAFAATADNPSAIYYNPAGISQLSGDQVRAGLYFISADTEYHSSTFGDAETDAHFQVVPQLYYTHEIKDTPFTFGFGVYAPYGLGLEWEDTPSFAPIARKGKLEYATANPVIAWQAHKTLSLAIGATLNYAEVKLKSTAYEFKGSDFRPGFNAGILYQPLEQLSFGLKYHYATDLDFDGESEFPGVPGSEDLTHAKAHFPQFVAGGVSYRPTTNWNFEVDVDWTDWDSLNTVNFKRDDNINVPFVFNYTSSWMYEFGVTRQLGKGWFISVGYIYSENSSPDASFNPIVPDSNLHLGSIGVGHHGETWDWAIGYHFAYGEREQTGSTLPFGLTNGEYKTFNNAINISATFKF